MSNSIIIDHSIKLIKVLKSCETPAQYEVAYRMFVNFQKLYRNILNDELDWLDLNVYEEFVEHEDFMRWIQKCHREEHTEKLRVAIWTRSI